MFAEGGRHTSSQEHTHPHHPLPPPPPHHPPHHHLSCLAPQPFYSQWAAVGWWEHLERFCLNCDGDRVWPLAGGDVAAAGNHPPTCHLPVTSHFFTRPHFLLFFFELNWVNMVIFVFFHICKSKQLVGEYPRPKTSWFKKAEVFVVVE